MFLTEWIRRRNILIGLVVGCAWLFAMPAPVQAQTMTCETPKIEGRDMIWASYVTPEEINPGGLGIIVGHGYADGSSGDEVFGFLKNRTFTVASGTWPIDSITVATLDTAAGQLAFSLFGSTTDPTDLSTQEIADLQLHVCDQTFAFSAAATSDDDHAYKWSSSGLDWSGVAFSNLRISQPTRFAQTVPVVTPSRGPDGAELVSNLNATGAGNSTSTRNFTFHQTFTTGDHPGGYKVTRVRYQLVGSQPGNRFSSWITTTGGSQLTRLQEKHGRQALTLLTPQNKETVLSASTTYRLAFWTPDRLTSRVTRSGSDTGLTGWSIANTWAGSSTYSLQFKIQGAPVVAAPANLRAAIAGNDIGIAWERIANETTGIPTGTENGYEIQYCDNDCGDDGAGWTHLAITRTNEHPDTGAVAKLYRQGMDGRSYRVRVFNGLHWPFSNVVRVTPPAAVSGCQAPNLSGRDAIWSGEMNTGTSKVTTYSFGGWSVSAVGYSPLTQ